MAVQSCKCTRKHCGITHDARIPVVVGKLDEKSAKKFTTPSGVIQSRKFDLLELHFCIAKGWNCVQHRPLWSLSLRSLRTFVYPFCSTWWTLLKDEDFTIPSYCFMNGTWYLSTKEVVSPAWRLAPQAVIKGHELQIQGAHVNGCTAETLMKASLQYGHMLGMLVSSQANLVMKIACTGWSHILYEAKSFMKWNDVQSDEGWKHNMLGMLMSSQRSTVEAVLSGWHVMLACCMALRLNWWKRQVQCTSWSVFHNAMKWLAV